MEATALIIAGALLLGVGTAFTYYATYAVRSQWLGQTYWHGRSDTSAVALTFDDGPSLDTEKVLDVLAEQNVKATFFLVGRHVEALPQTARRIAAEGHEVGNHSYSHPIYLFRTPKETRRQLERAQIVITAATNVRPRFARPPCGVRTPTYFAATRRLGLQTIQWDIAGFDWKRRSAEEIAVDVLRQVRAGSIILLHDGDSEGKHERHQTVAALPMIIRGLRECGLNVVPLAELLSEGEVKLAA